jgi:pyrimidine-nucleoside phosphorylase
MNFLPLLEAKRNGQALTTAQVRDVVFAYNAGLVPDYQMAAFLMAVFFRGMNDEETHALMLAMRDTGDVLKFPEDPRPLVDKHSTGGVGDKASLPLVPLLACLGFRVPMVSGRGLGITGGTLDKLESIPGFITALTTERIIECVQEVGCCMAGQTAYMVPADMKLYALRDATGTVPSPPLIVASILSKKLAESVDALVLDVKFGNGAFMPDLAKARELAKSLVAAASECRVNARAFLSDMNTPLGRAAGNWLEVREAVDCLECNGPEDLQELVLHLAASLLVQTGKSPDMEAALNKAGAMLASGKPREKWNEMLAAQGAHLDEFNVKLARDRTAPFVLEHKAAEGGFVTGCDARIIGEIVRELGGGRFTKEDIIDYEVGIDRLARPGEPVQAGQVLGRVHALRRHQAEQALPRLQGAITLGAEPPPEKAPLICETIG